MLVTSIFSFPHNVFKGSLLLGHEKIGFFDERLKSYHELSKLEGCQVTTCQASVTLTFDLPE